LGDCFRQHRAAGGGAGRRVYKDEPHKRMAVALSGATERSSQVRYRLLRSIVPDSLVEVELITGRKHQIDCSWRPAARSGDRKYGSSQPFAAGIALHARRLVIEHPTRHEPVEIVAPLPSLGAVGHRKLSRSSAAMSRFRPVKARAFEQRRCFGRELARFSPVSRAIPGNLPPV